MDGVSVFARILVRYGVGFLVAWGALSPETAELIIADPDIVVAIALFLGGGIEAWHLFSRGRQ